MKNKSIAVLAADASTVTAVMHAQANTGLLLEDLNAFSNNAEYSQGSDGHVIIDCWRDPRGNGEAVISAWRLRSPFAYVNGAVTFSESLVPHALNGSPVGFSVPWSRVNSGSEELYLEDPLDATTVYASISGYVELGVEHGGILPTSTTCPHRAS